MFSLQFHELCGYYRMLRMLEQVLVWPHVSRTEARLTYYGHSSIYCQVTTEPYIVWLLQNAGARLRVATCITDSGKPHILWAQFHILCGYYRMLEQVLVWPHVSRTESSLTYYGHSSIYCVVSTKCWTKSPSGHMYHG